MTGVQTCALPIFTARMLGNVAVDGVVGLVPVAGDAFDVLFRANMRNVRLLRRWLDKQPR